MTLGGGTLVRKLRLQDPGRPPLPSEAAIRTPSRLRAGRAVHTCGPPHHARQGQVPCCGAKDGRGVRLGAVPAPSPALCWEVGQVPGPA